MRLVRSSTATFGANGRAVTTLGPVIHTERWDVSKVVVSTTSTTESEVHVYRGSEAPRNLLEASYSGNQDVSDTHLQMIAPEILTIVWTNGTPGATATAVVEGEVNHGLSKSNPR